MRIDFAQMEETLMPNFYAGQGLTAARSFTDTKIRILYGRLQPGASIGLHTHETSSEVIYILLGCGQAICMDEVEDLTAGVCHYCAQGQAHSLINTGTEDLLFFAVVPQQ